MSDALYASKDEVFKKETGKNLKTWKSIIEKAGMDEKGHEPLLEFLKEKHELPENWAEAVCVRYQRDKFL